VQHETRDARRLGGKLKPPACRHRQRLDLSHDGGESRIAQPFFHRPQRLLVVLRARQKQPPGCQTIKGEARRVQIGASEAPQHGPLGRKPRQDAGKESRRHGAILALRPDAFDLVQRAQGQAAPRQAGIDGDKIEGQDRHRPAAALKRR